MIGAGEDILWVNQMLGHSTPDTTLRVYAKYIKNDKANRGNFLRTFSNENNCTLKNE